MMAMLGVFTVACGSEKKEPEKPDAQEEQAGDDAEAENTEAVANKDKPLVWFNRQPSDRYRRVPG